MNQMALPIKNELDLPEFEKGLFADFVKTIPEEEPKYPVKMGPNGKWRVVSSLQKAVRRGDVEHAKRAAYVLATSSDESYLWHRMAVIAIEEASLEHSNLIGTALFLSRNKKIRAKLGLAKVAVEIASRLAAASKDRVLCHMNGLVKNPRYNGIREKMLSAHDDILWEAATNPSMDMGHRVLAWKGLAGQLSDNPFVKRGEAKWRPHNKQLFVELVNSFELPESVQYLLHKGKALGVEGFFTNVALAHEIYEMDKDSRRVIKGDYFPNHTTIKGIISAAYDKHTLEGKRALAYFSRSAGYYNWCQEKKLNPVDILGMATFLVEGGEVLKDRVSHETTDNLLDEMFWYIRDRFGFENVEWEEFLESVKGNLDKLDAARRRILLGK